LAYNSGFLFVGFEFCIWLLHFWFFFFFFLFFYRKDGGISRCEVKSCDICWWVQTCWSDFYGW